MASLITLAALRAYLSIPPDQTEDDALLQTLITAASARIEAAIGRSILSAERTDVLDGNGKTRLMFPAWPVTAVAEVSVNGHSIPAAASFGAGGYRFDPTMLVACGHCFVRGHRNVRLTYTAGFASTPPDIAQACMQMVGAAFAEKDRLGVGSKSLAGETITYIDVAMSPGVQSMLNAYRRVS